MSKAVHFIWGRILGMLTGCLCVHLIVAVTGFPSLDVIEGLANKLNGSLRGNYMIFNLSGLQYDTDIFENQVIDVGVHRDASTPFIYEHPISLDTMIQTARSVVSWLRGDGHHVAVLHCRDEKRWSCLLVAFVLCELNEMTATEGLEQVQRNLDRVVISPAQRRYAEYYDRVPGGQLQSLQDVHIPLRLNRLVVQTRPLLGSEYAPGTVPYVELHEGGRVVFTSKWSHLDKYDAEDGLVSFHLDVPVRGDVVLELWLDYRQHRAGVTNHGKLNMCSYAFNAYFVPPGPVQLTGKDLDMNDRAWFLSEDQYIHLFISEDTEALATSTSVTGRTQHRTPVGGVPTAILGPVVAASAAAAAATLSVQTPITARDPFAVHTQCCRLYAHRLPRRRRHRRT